MKKRYVVYVIIEALLVALAVYMINVLNRLPVADSMASIGYDITLSKDAYIEDAGITLSKGTTVKPTVIANANKVTFYADEYDGRLSLDVEYFVEKEDLIKLYEQQISEAKKTEKRQNRKRHSVFSNCFCSLLVYCICINMDMQGRCICISCSQGISSPAYSLRCVLGHQYILREI